MADQGAFGIGWTDTTWNFSNGCLRVSEGCRNCYAEGIAARFSGPNLPYEGLARMRSDGTPQWTGLVRVAPARLAAPLRWRRPRLIFADSMSDLFYEGLPDLTVAAVLGIMAAAPQHIFQVLTKRARRMAALVGRLTAAECLDAAAGALEAFGEAAGGRAAQVAFARGRARYEAAGSVWPLPNVWMLVSVENQAAADERVPALVATPAAVRGLSCEPLLGAVNVRPWVHTLDWVIAGGEAGRHARPMSPAWPRGLRDQCEAAGVPYYFKQWGNWVPADDPGDAFMRRVPKRTAGRMLDGRRWDGMPDAGLRLRAAAA